MCCIAATVKEDKSTWRQGYSRHVKHKTNKMQGNQTNKSIQYTKQLKWRRNNPALKNKYGANQNANRDPSKQASVNECQARA